MCNIKTLDEQSKSDQLAAENERLQQTVKTLQFAIKDLTLANVTLTIEKQTLVYEITRLLSVFQDAGVEAAAGFEFPAAWAGEPAEIWRDNG